ncbi:MAG: ImmA/IrrE family metallo-endopeptidase, partial [Cyanobacteria bacterium J06555_13]
MKISLQPTLLSWARERAGFDVDVLAKKMNVKVDKVLSWEKDGHISFNQAEKLAKVTYTPFGYLYLPEPPHQTLPITDFRTLRSEEMTQPSPNLLATLDQAQQIQTWFRSELLARGQSPLPFVGRLSQALPVMEAADLIRQTVSFDVASLASNWEEAFSLQVEKIENSGVVVIRNGIVGSNTHRSLSVEEFRGFALSDDIAPLIFVNGKDAKAAQMFTLAHELVHIWVGTSGVSNLTKTYAEHEGIEQFCNQVAAELLVPSVALREQWVEQKSQDNWLPSLARWFKVSSLVILRRLKDNSLISS